MVSRVPPSASAPSCCLLLVQAAVPGASGMDAYGRGHRGNNSPIVDPISMTALSFILQSSYPPVLFTQPMVLVWKG